METENIMVESIELKILDELLKYLNKTELNTLVDLRKDTIKKSDFLKKVNNFTFKAALVKLTKDGYVTKTSKETIDQTKTILTTHYFYDISFEGIFFIKNGGYRQEVLIARRKEDEYERLNAEQKLHASSLLRVNERLVYLTWIIAIGTGIAAVYYFFEILAFFGLLQNQKT